MHKIKKKSGQEAECKFSHFDYLIPAPVFQRSDRFDNQVIDFDCRELMEDDRQIIKLISRGKKSLIILTHSELIENGSENLARETSGQDYLFSAKIANKVTILSPVPMEFLKI